jgi:hypothetical protein
LWNKWTGDVRIENPSANQVILVNINTLKAKYTRMVLLVQDEIKVNGLLEKGNCGLMIPLLVMPWNYKTLGEFNLMSKQNNYQMVQRQIYYSLLLMLLV